jgi:hypothetical protein
LVRDAVSDDHVIERRMMKRINLTLLLKNWRHIAGATGVVLLVCLLWLGLVLSRPLAPSFIRALSLVLLASLPLWLVYGDYTRVRSRIKKGMGLWVFDTYRCLSRWRWTVVILTVLFEIFVIFSLFNGSKSLYAWYIVGVWSLGLGLFSLFSTFLRWRIDSRLLPLLSACIPALATQKNLMSFGEHERLFEELWQEHKEHPEEFLRLFEPLLEAPVSEEELYSALKSKQAFWAYLALVSLCRQAERGHWVVSAPTLQLVRDLAVGMRAGKEPIVAQEAQRCLPILQTYLHADHRHLLRASNREDRECLLRMAGAASEEEPSRNVLLRSAEGGKEQESDRCRGHKEGSF